MSIVMDNSENVLKTATSLGAKVIDQFCAEMSLAASAEAPHDTGNLAQTITHEVDDDLTGLVYTETGKKDGSTGYGIWVHEGHSIELKDGSTVEVPANPFFRRAYEITRNAYA